jgi:hypothetical protein
MIMVAYHQMNFGVKGFAFCDDDDDDDDDDDK